MASEEDAERAVRAALDLVGAVDGLEAPLTGRDAELRTVRELFHATADRRVPRLVLVSGPAGVGKSRLGWEFDLVRAWPPRTARRTPRPPSPPRSPACASAALPITSRRACSITRSSC